jgi:hypothetical protein
VVEYTKQTDECIARLGCRDRENALFAVSNAASG